MKEEKKFYTAKYDRVFKTILCDEDNKSLLEEFLSRLLNKKVEFIEFLRNELPVNTTLEKVKTVDVLVKVDNEYTHIEINGCYPSYLHIRNFIYFSTLYSKKVQRGEEYDLVTKFLHLDLTYGMNSDKDYISYYIQSNDKEKYLKNIEIIEYNMDKIISYWYNKNIQKVNLYKHLIMLDLETDGLKNLSKGDDFVKDFKDKIVKLNETETFQSAMTYEQDQKLILNTEKHISFNEGLEKGLKEKQLEIAKSLLKENILVETISKCTGLSIDEINNL